MDEECLSEVDNESFPSACVISPYSEKIVEHIAGFVSCKLKRSLWCERCCNVLLDKMVRRIVN